MNTARGHRSTHDHIFSEIPEANVPRSTFRRPFKHTTTCDAGYLIPAYIDEVLPGDTIQSKGTILARLNSAIVPFMDNLYLSTFAFFVPMRLVWPNFKKMLGEQANPTDSISYSTPQMTSPAGGILSHTLGDYFGLPVGVAAISYNSYFHRAYNLIWNEWFRDENLQNSVVVDTDDGPDTYTDYVLLKRGKRHDYFTSCLPNPQKGSAGVSLPLGTSAPITLATPSAPGFVLVRRNDTGALSGAIGGANFGVNGANSAFINTGVGDNPKYAIDPNGTMIANLSGATAATINSLRQAFQIQRLLERDSRAGTRYTEVVLAHFGVHSPDARLQRPEFLGGSESPIYVTPVPQTSVTAATPQGNLAAYAVGSTRDGWTKSFTEHGLIMVLFDIRADLSYQQGLDIMFTRRTRYDFYMPVLANLGEQAVLNREIYCDASANDTLVFGYQERWAEYRYAKNKLTGLMRHNVTAGFATLDYWHLGEVFGALPTLSAAFIQSSAGTVVDRVVAVPSQPQFYVDIFFDNKWTRPMPVYSVPGMIDHF